MNSPHENEPPKWWILLLLMSFGVLTLSLVLWGGCSDLGDF